jgi:hypothetical protein
LQLNISLSRSIITKILIKQAFLTIYGCADGGGGDGTDEEIGLKSLF